MDMQNSPQTQQSEPLPAALLFVDDEPNILAALRRLFRPLGYRIFTAASGAQGLDVIASESIDLVVSDMRMPEMNGAHFLEQVRLKSPASVRILLTGYADIASTIDAVNKGQIYRYIAKPWDDNDIVITVRYALQSKQLEQERARLELLTQRQNEELKDLNANLESRVKARTEELRQTVGFLDIAHEALKKSFFTSILMFSNLLELREGTMAGYSRRVADISHRLAMHLGMSEAEAQDVMVAGLLHDIGKIGLPDSLLLKPFSMLNADEYSAVAKHPIVGQSALMALEQLSGAAKLIRSHHERFDGKGYPDGLLGLEIPFGARVLNVANDYESVQLGRLLNKRMSAKEALSFIQEGRGSRYDPQVVDAFTHLMEGVADVDKIQEQALHASDLKDGMILARDLISKAGFLMLARDFQLDNAIIEQIRKNEQMDNHPLTVYVRTRR